MVVESTLVGPHETRAHERGTHTYPTSSSALHRSDIRKIGSINTGRAGKKECHRRAAGLVFCAPVERRVIACKKTRQNTNYLVPNLVKDSLLS